MAVSLPNSFQKCGFSVISLRVRDEIGNLRCFLSLTLGQNVVFAVFPDELGKETGLEQCFSP